MKKIIVYQEPINHEMFDEVYYAKHPHTKSPVREGIEYDVYARGLQIQVHPKHPMKTDPTDRSTDHEFYDKHPVAKSNPTMRFFKEGSIVRALVSTQSFKP